MEYWNNMRSDGSAWEWSYIWPFSRNKMNSNLTTHIFYYPAFEIMIDRNIIEIARIASQKIKINGRLFNRATFPFISRTSKIPVANTMVRPSRFQRWDEFKIALNQFLPNRIFLKDYTTFTTDNPVVLVQLGDMSNPLTLLGAGAFISMIVMEKMKIKGNIIIGILAFSAIAWVTGLGNFNGVTSMPPPMTHLMTFDLGAALSASMVTVVFTLFFIDFFDTAGTLTSVANVSGKIGSDGKIKDIDKAMLSDSVSSVAGAMLGTSTVTTYVESAAGVKAGGRTGMTSLVIGVLFLACLFFSPLATSLPKEVDAAALIYIATLFVRNITDIEWDDAAEAGPAVLAMIAMPFTYSISNGIALAFISYAAIKICTGKIDSTSPAIWVIAILSVISFAVA